MSQKQIILRGWQKCFFEVSGALQVHFGSLKVRINADTIVENFYTVKSAWKCEKAKENRRLHGDCLWDAILHNKLATFFVNSGILLSLCASAHHPHTTTATGEWMTSWPGPAKIVLLNLEVGSTECTCSRHLVLQLSLHFRLLPHLYNCHVI